MKIIITENQLNNKIHQLVKELGWEETCNTLGLTWKELAQKFFNNNPMEFLNLFNDVAITQNERTGVTYNRKELTLHFMTPYLKKGFGLDNYDIENLTQKWLPEH